MSVVGTSVKMVFIHRLRHKHRMTFFFIQMCGLKIVKKDTSL